MLFLNIVYLFFFHLISMGGGGGQTPLPFLVFEDMGSLLNSIKGQNFQEVNGFLIYRKRNGRNR